MPGGKIQVSFNKELFSLRDYWNAVFFVLCMVAGAILLYRGPSFLGPLMQIAVLALFYRSKQPWFWVAVYMFLTFSPGGLYQISLPRNLVILSTSIIGDLTFTLAFSIIAIIKTIIFRKVNVFFKAQWLLVFVFMLLLIPLFGAKFTYLIKGFANFSLLISIPMLLRTQSDYDHLFILIFTCNIFVLFTNIYQVTEGYPLVRPLSGPVIESVESTYYIFRIEDVSGMIRPIWGAEFAFLSLMGALFYVTYKASPFRRSFLYSMILLSWVNIMFSATRGWIIASTLMIFIYTFIMIPRLFRSIMIMLPLLVIAFLGIWQIPVIRIQLQKSFARLETSESILSGEFTIEATGGRAQRAELTMSKFRESPVIGWGFGKDSMEYWDGHTGNQTILLQFGVMGYFLMVVLWLRFIFGLISRKKTRYIDDYKNTNIVPVISFLGLFIIHSTSGMQLHPFTGGVFAAMIFSMGNFLYFTKERQTVTESLVVPDARNSRPSINERISELFSD